MLYSSLLFDPEKLLLLAIAFFRGSLTDALDAGGHSRRVTLACTYRAIFLEFIRHLYHARTFNILKEISYFPVSIAPLIKFNVMISSTPILVTRDVMLGRCAVDVGSTRGRCGADVGSM